ncbi:2-C-methyl-D-erythritol 4-phosphate cytidylyltransferase [bioreactor metagenome]|uniref:2-C-methyl-D-erythritol 4-phosphate cytidylyltransferase n=1 Tax=bioreactor metagenome TaxID=1076179 RepID=A0A645CYI4_9ZZZZ|nr:2-C-methyl-D-erythritol 4-phosphate cytidylyltransferase [Erysipelotrichaceae bacterium]
MNYAVLIVAAGKGSRMNLGYNKVFYELEDGITVLQKTLTAFLDDERCKQIVVVLNRDDMKRPFKRECGRLVRVFGGVTRQDSVYNGLMAVKEEYVLIHDGARPGISMECIDNLLETLKSEDACILAVKSKDTLKKVEQEYVVETVDRSSIYQAQTPQAFKTQLIIDCHKKALALNIKATDDSQVVELTSDTKIKVVYGDEKNIKLTTRQDLLNLGR